MAVVGVVTLMASPAVHASDVASATANWRSCYVGAHLGYGQSASDVTDLTYAEGDFAGLAAWNAAGDQISPEDRGITGGGQLGCDWQMASLGQAVVLGLVGDISALGASGMEISSLAADTEAGFEADWAATLRARLGAVHADTLFYVTGGVAFADLEIRAVDSSGTPGVGEMNVAGGETKTGWVLGGGAEWQLGNHLSLGVEYLHLDFGNVVATGESSNIPGAFPRFEGDLSIDTARVGLNWRM